LLKKGLTSNYIANEVGLSTSTVDEIKRKELYNYLDHLI